MRREEMTIRQNAIFDFIRDKITNDGFPPTVREIGFQFNILSPNGVMCHLRSLERKGLITRRSHLSRGIQIVNETARRPVTEIPLLGSINAGPLCPAEELAETIDLACLTRPGMFALTVRGDSMQDAGILNGDVVMIREAQTASDGQIVAVMVDDDVTLKRIFRESETVCRLEPCNSSMAPIYAERAQVIGVMAAVLRFA